MSTMFKYFKKQRSRLNSSNENDPQTDQVDNAVGVSAGSCGQDFPEEVAGAALKRHSLRSTTSIHSFCEEVFLEELSNQGIFTAHGPGGNCGGSDNDDAVSYGALSLGALSSCYNGTGGSVSHPISVHSMMGYDEELFKCHSRLSMNLTSIVCEPNCLSYFVQYLDKKNALPLIKFYLDTENFKNSALAQLRKELKCKLMSQQIPEEVGGVTGADDVDTEITTTVITQNDTDDDQIQNKQQQQQQVDNQTRGGERHINVLTPANVGNTGTDIEADDSCHVSELKTLCDLSMRKPLTDDEKSQIYAETNKHIYKTNERHKLKASSELSLCSLMSNFSEINENAIISMASVKDALGIYTKYLIQDSKERIELPVDILSKISLIICKKDEHEDAEEGGSSTTITADCFLEAQQYVLNKLEKDFLSDFLQSTYYAKYCVDLIEGHCININDILHSEVTLFYFMEYLEQHHERDCLDFWSTAINYRKSYVSSIEMNEKEAQSDAMIIYEKFFSLQNESKLWSSNKLRANVEACICTEGMVYHCFDLPLKVAAKYLERKYLGSFLKSSLFSNYMNELKSKIQDETDAKDGLTTNKFPKKLALRRCVSDKSSNRHRKTLSDCTLDKKLTISQHNTLLASMDNHSHNQHQQRNQAQQRQQTLPTSSSATNLEKFHMSIDSSQLTNPDLLWHRSNSNNLKFGRVNSLGRYERDFISPSDALHKTANTSSNWSLSLKGTKLKNAMRKLVNLREDNVQEEIAWQVAEMIVKDVTSVTMAAHSNCTKDKTQQH
uniref:RGS domain-containing protein n=1 Tax=Stomoxys calcitrans TaxID=35570 RepID=A0A1I8NQI9_STOCA